MPDLDRYCVMDTSTAKFCIRCVISGGSKGARGTRAILGAQTLSISCGLWENLAKSYVGAPLGSWRPLLGEILDQPLVMTDVSGPYSSVSAILISLLSITTLIWQDKLPPPPIGVLDLN